VDVLVRWDRGELAGGHVGVEPVQSAEHVLELDLVEQTGACQDACVRPRPLDVVPGEPPVEVGGEAECGEGIGWAVHEAPAPQAGGLVSHDPPPGVSRSRRGGPAWRGGSHRRPSA